MSFLQFFSKKTCCIVFSLSTKKKQILKMNIAMLFKKHTHNVSKKPANVQRETSALTVLLPNSIFS